MEIKIPNKHSSINLTNYKSELINPSTKYSGWKCYLFGNKNGIAFEALEGDVPNWFWRKMQYLLLGNRWIKTANRCANTKHSNSKVIWK